MAKFQSRTGIDESKRMYAHAALQKRYNDEATADLERQLRGQESIMQTQHDFMTRRENGYVKAYVKMLEDFKTFGKEDLPTMVRDYLDRKAAKESTGENQEGAPKEVGNIEEKGDLTEALKDGEVEREENEWGPLGQPGASKQIEIYEKSLPKPKEGDGFTEESETSKAKKIPPKPLKKSLQPKGEVKSREIQQLQGISAKGTYPSYKTDYEVKSGLIIDAAANTDSLIGGALSKTIEDQDLDAFGSERIRQKYRSQSFGSQVVLANTALDNAGVIDSTLIGRLGTDQRLIEARFSDGSVHRWKIADTEKLAEDNPEYYHQALRFLQGDEEQRLLDMGLSPMYVASKLQPIYRQKLGRLLTDFNHAWVLTKTDSALRAGDAKVRSSFLYNLGDPVDIMTGVFAEQESLYRSRRNIPGGEKLFRKAALNRRVELHESLMKELMLVKGYKAADAMNKVWSGFLVKVPWENGLVPQSQAFPKEFGVNVLTDKLDDFHREEFNEAKAEIKIQATENYKEIENAILINRSGNTEDEGYKTDIEIYEMKQNWIMKYASVEPTLFKKMADKQAQLKGEGASLAILTNMYEDTADDAGQWGRISIREALNRGVHPLALKRWIDENGKDKVEEDGEFDISEDDIKKPRRIVEVSVRGNGKLLIKNKIGGQQYEKMLQEAYDDLDTRSWALYQKVKGTDDAMSVPAAYLKTAKSFADEIEDDNVWRERNVDLDGKPLSEPRKGKGKYGVTGGTKWDWLENRGASVWDKVNLKTDLIKQARDIATARQDIENPFLTVALQDIPPNYYKNNKRGELNSFWFELAAIQRSMNPGQKVYPTAFEIATEQARLHNETIGVPEDGPTIQVETPFDWDEYRNKNIREKLKQTGFGNINQKDTATVNRSIEAIGGIPPQQFRVAMAFQESGNNHMSITGDSSNPQLGFYGTLWSNVVRIAPLIGEQVPATHDEFLNNTALQHKIFEYTNNQYIQEIAKMGVTDSYVAVRILAAAHRAGPRVFTEADLDGNPIWRSPTFGLLEGTNNLSMQDYTQQVLDTYRAGRLSLEFSD